MSNTTTDVIAERLSASGAADDRGKAVNPIKGLAGIRPVGLARLPAAQPVHERRVQSPDRRRTGCAASPPIRRSSKRRSPAAPIISTRLQEIERRRDLEPMALYEALAIRDIREAADLLRPVYDATGRRGRLRQPGSVALSRARHRRPRSRRRAACGRRSVATT